MLAILFVSTGPGKSSASTGKEGRPSAGPYGVRGPNPVGKRHLRNEDDTSLHMKMWYPALPAGDQKAKYSYAYEIKIRPPLGTVALASSSGRAVPDAAFDLKHGPYPLVVLSPGFAIGATSYGWLAEHLASHGFVVIAPEHEEHLDPGNELWPAAITRPQDILAVFSYVDAAVGPGAALEGLIDSNLTAVIGHSYGGYTALAAAGAQIETASFEDHCHEATAAEDPAAWLCEVLLPRSALTPSNLTALSIKKRGISVDFNTPKPYFRICTSIPVCRYG